MVSVDKLEEVFVKTQQDEVFLLGKISIPAEKEYFVGSLEFTNVDLALYNLFVSKSTDLARGNFYKAGMVVAYMHEFYNEDIFLIRFFTYPILSDSSQLIEKFVEYKRSKWGNTFGAYFGWAIQSVLKRDKESLKINIEGLEGTCKKAWEKRYAGAIKVFKGILERNPPLAKEGIEELLTNHKKQDINELLKEFMSLEATALLKLTRYAGMEIEISNDLVPEDILSIKELSEYPIYEFLEEMNSK
jgi:hypothetical protein